MNLSTGSSSGISLFLCGDVMPGRGMDQILPHPSAPDLYESYVVDARDYVALAERIYGPIPRHVSYDYIWGDALALLEQIAPDVRIINLETAITRSNTYWQGKGINYRMHPANTPCLTALRIDGCALANNHVLDWGYPGLTDTLEALHEVGIRTAGAGTTLMEALAPAIFQLPGKGRVLLFSFGHPSSGIPLEWAATPAKAGIALIESLNDIAIRDIAARVHEYKSRHDIIVASIHWGGNWGYAVPEDQRRFAHQLIDEAGFDLIHGHSSHHPKGIEIYHGKPILYGCGDLLNDYEGISGYEHYRDDLALMYFPTMDPATGDLMQFRLSPMQIQRFRLNKPSRADTLWLAEMLNREGELFGTEARVENDGQFTLLWS